MNYFSVDCIESQHGLVKIPMIFYSFNFCKNQGVTFCCYYCNLISKFVVSLRKLRILTSLFIYFNYYIIRAITILSINNTQYLVQE